MGFEEPMPVQQEVIPLMMNDDCDLIALAQTGTGKTAAFGLPLVQMTDTSFNSVQALVLCPTRELCMQIAGDLTDFARYTGKIRILPVYGGASIENQIRELRKGVHIIAATPGRLIDLINRGAVKLNSVSTVILDEADEMLNMGFLDSINEILEEVPHGRRTLLFSATMSQEISGIAKKYMNSAREVTIGRKNASAENVRHGYYLVNSRDKYKVLKRIADSEPDIYAIIFCRTRKETQEIASQLIDDGYNADALHGDLSQAQRDTVMQKFRLRNLQLLVATDVAARGLDVDDLTHVINYTLPDDTEVYTHRSGRTGRAGKKGISISLIGSREMHNLKQIEKLLKKSIEAIRIPTGSEICGKQLFHWAKKIETVATEHQEIEKYLPAISEKLASLDREELLRRVVSLEFDRFLDDYREGEELFYPAAGYNESQTNKKTRGREFHGKFKRLFINLGKTDGFYPEQLIDLVNRNSQGKKIQLGRIDLMKTFSFFEVDEEFAPYLTDVLNKSKFNDRKVSVEPAQEKTERTEGREDRKWKKGKMQSDGPLKRKDKNKFGKGKADKKYSGKDKKDRKRYSW